MLFFWVKFYTIFNKAVTVSVLLLNLFCAGPHTHWTSIESIVWEKIIVFDVLLTIAIKNGIISLPNECVHFFSRFVMGHQVRLQWSFSMSGADARWERERETTLYALFSLKSWLHCTKQINRFFVSFSRVLVSNCLI